MKLLAITFLFSLSLWACVEEPEHPPQTHYVPPSLNAVPGGTFRPPTLDDR